MADSAAIKSAHKFALAMAEHASTIVAVAAAGGANYYSRSGDHTEDAADLLAESAMAIEQVDFLSRDALQRGEDAFAAANMAITPIASRHGITSGGVRYNSAHEAIVGWTRSVASAVRTFDGNEIVFHRGNQFPIDVNRLRDNLSEACEFISEAEFALDSTEIENLLADAKLERIKSLAALQSSAANSPATNESQSPAPIEDATYLTAELCKEIGIAASSLRKCARLAGVAAGTPGRARRYTGAERSQILNAVVNNCRQPAIVAKCRKLLTETANKPQSRN